MCIMSKQWMWKFAALLIFGAMLAGCSGAQPSLEPTVDTQPTFSLIQTQAVQTAVVEMTLNAPSATPIVATETQAPAPEATATEAAPTAVPPTNTPVPVLPTATNTVPVITVIPRTSTPASTPTAGPLGCTITESSPPSGADLTPGVDFDGRWVVKNTGTDTWRASEVDVRYVSGTKFQVRVDAFDLPADVAPNGTFTIIVDMLAPKDPGRYTANWAVIRGGTTICSLPLVIDVVQ
jgi:hypothetical protein